MRKKIAVLIVSFFLLFSGLCFAGSKININKANINELSKLDRIGKAYAKRIVEYREKNGGFTSIEDLMKVKGIGKKTFEINKDKITVQDQKKK